MAKAKQSGLIEVSQQDKKNAKKAGFRRAEPTFATKRQNNPTYVAEFVEKYNTWALDLHRAVADKKTSDEAAKAAKEYTAKNVLPFVKKSKGISGVKKSKGVSGLKGVKRRAVR